MDIAKPQSNLIATVTPIRNGYLFIPGLASCIQNQTMLPAMSVLSDNHSSDGTGELLHAYKAINPFCVCHQRQSLDAHHSFTAALEVVDAEYAMFLPCDDRIHPQNIEYAHKILSSNPHIDTLGSSLQRFSSLELVDAYQWDVYNSPPPVTFLSPRDVMVENLKSCLLFIPITGLIVRTQILKELVSSGRLPIFEGAIDVALILTLINEKRSFAMRPEAWTNVLMHPQQESQRLKHKWLSDNILLADYTFSLKNIEKPLHKKLCAYILKGLILNYAYALQGLNQDVCSTKIKFRNSYFRSLCSALRKHGVPLLPLLMHRSIRANFRSLLLLTSFGSSAYASRMRGHLGLS